MKYAWRFGNTTYLEDRRYEDTVIFDDRIKPHFIKVKSPLSVYAHLTLYLKHLVNAVLEPPEGYST